MDSTTAIAAIMAYSQTKSLKAIPFSLDEVMHALHDLPEVAEHAIFLMDNDKLDVDIFNALADVIGEVALQRFDNPADRRDWMGKHGFGEIYLFAAWSLYRGGQLERATEAAMGCLHFSAGHPIATKLLGLIGMEQTNDPDLEFDHDTLPKLEIGEGGEVIWPEAVANLQAAAINFKVDRRWTK